MNKGQGHMSLHGCFAAAALMRLFCLTKYTNINSLSLKSQTINIYIRNRPRGVVAYMKSQSSSKYETGTLNGFGKISI